MAERRMERLGAKGFALVLRLLPAELRRRAGTDMTATFADRQRDAGARGVAPLVALWVRELAGLLAAATRARLGVDARATGGAIGDGLGQDLRYVLRSLRPAGADAAKNEWVGTSPSSRVALARDAVLTQCGNLGN